MGPFNVLRDLYVPIYILLAGYLRRQAKLLFSVVSLFKDPQSSRPGARL